MKHKALKSQSLKSAFAPTESDDLITTLLAALEAVTPRLEAWMEIADDEDKRDEDYAALKQARTAIALVKLGES